MKPTEFYLSPNRATPQEIVSVLLKAGLNGGAFVRRAEDGKPPGLVVFLLNAAAIRQVGPFLSAFVGKLTNPSTQQYQIRADQDSSIPLTLQAMEEAGFQWAWTTIQFQTPAQPLGMMVFLVGPSVTEELAAELTKRGVICNLK